jgi:lipopolysaccharide assembly protein A
MRWIYLAIIILFAAATIIFALQNFEIVTVSLFGFDARVPLALLVAIAYLLGAATGGSCSRCCGDRTKVQGAG